MASAETLLAQAAEDGSFDSEEWPKTLEYILNRLDEIVNDFPKPTTALSDPLASSSASNTPPRPHALLSSQESHAADKENAPPATPPRPPVPAFAGNPPSSQSESPGIPPETVNFYSSIRTTLSKNFAKHPPHTIQRLAELILHPHTPYKYLPPYLRALDRVVSVSSPTTIFPLPQSVLPNTSGLLNGTATTPPSTLGSDESLGGALLTPIPWLQNRGSQSELISESTEMVQGPNGAGRIETVSVMNGQLTSAPLNQAQIVSQHPDGESLPSTGPVTQGEILRQEQEAGVMLSNPHSIHAHRPQLGDSVILETVEGEDEAPHARGPDVIGMEDIGPQRSSGGHLDIEAAVGRRSSRSPAPSTPAVTESDAKDEDTMQDGDGEAKAEDKNADENSDAEMKSDA